MAGVWGTSVMGVSGGKVKRSLTGLSPADSQQTRVSHPRRYGRRRIWGGAWRAWERAWGQVGGTKAKDIQQKRDLLKIQLRLGKSLVGIAWAQR